MSTCLSIIHLCICLSAFRSYLSSICLKTKIMFSLFDNKYVWSDAVSESQREDLETTSFLESSALLTLEWNLCSWNKRSLEGQGQLFWKESGVLGWGPGFFWPKGASLMGAHSKSGPWGGRRRHMPWCPQAVGKWYDRCPGMHWCSVGQCGLGGGLPGILPCCFSFGWTKTLQLSPALGDGLEWWRLQSFLIMHPSAKSFWAWTLTICVFINYMHIQLF